MLIVDDEPELTELLSAAVTEAGWRAFAAEDGRSALRIARGCAPHVVVLDGMLPDVDGVEVLRSLRGENARLPVLMLTARDGLEHRIDGLSAGADDYVTASLPAPSRAPTARPRVTVPRRCTSTPSSVPPTATTTGRSSSGSTT